MQQQRTTSKKLKTLPTTYDTTPQTEVNIYKQATQQLEEEKQALEAENELITHAAKEAQEDLKKAKDRASVMENEFDQCKQEKHSMEVRIHGYEALLTEQEVLMDTRNAETEEGKIKANAVEEKASQILEAIEWLQGKLTEADEQPAITKAQLKKRRLRTPKR